MDLTPQAAFLLACILISYTREHIANCEVAILSLVIQRTVDSRKSPHWVSAFETWKRNSDDRCIEFIGQFLPKAYTMPLLANLADIASADGRMADDKRLVFAKIVLALDAQDCDLETYLRVIHEKNALFDE